MRGDLNMDCKDALPLVPSYLDAELTEAQAAPLRKHLLACQPCRAEAQSAKNLKRWFVPTAEVAVPRDFAARVASLAFASAGAGYAAPAEREFVLPARTAARETPVLPFVLRLTAVAAVLALVLSVAIRSLSLPSSAELRADDRPAPSLDEALQRLEAIERAEKGLSPAKPAAPERPAQRP